jgi:predicted nucleotidyltransferase
MILQRLLKEGLIHPPDWLDETTTHYLTIMGSEAYGASSGGSDIDVYGFCVPPRYLTFPHLAGEIIGFGNQLQRFEQWSQHHIKHNAKEYDFSIYSIVKFFDLCMANNPNMLDALFTPRRCVIHSTEISEHMRENRKLFLHKGSFHKFRGYFFSQMNKIKTRTNSANPSRTADIETFGFDLKFAYNVVRIALESEQILVEHDLDLERNSEILKSIRRGEWTLERLEKWIEEKERSLETAYVNSSLPFSPDQEKIKEVLCACLEMAYGNLDHAVARSPSVDRILDDLRTIVKRYDPI